ncbi:MAG: M20/M25/M40 family metallo-hydrolase [Chloroflexi bacterium]|nr:M20/M25/M40 family metallo-hydrolase [Chloroflexota bacterium]
MLARQRRVLLFVFLVFIFAPNSRALYEGIFYYLRDAIPYSSTRVKPIDPSGRYAALYELVRLRNADRFRFLNAQLGALNLNLEQISIPQSQTPNLFVTIDRDTPVTIFVAHYDKLYDDTAYQGASDNSAAVSVLLAAAKEFARRGETRHLAFLFTAEEERGLRGAAAFVEYARAHNLQIRALINFDNLGRGNLAIRPLAEIPGFVFWLPFIGDITFDGAQFRATAPYPRANAQLAQLLARLQPDIVMYERFTARGDANVFAANGFDTVAISGDDMYYLQQTWHTYADRIELLDEKNLDAAYEMIMRFQPPRD